MYLHTSNTQENHACNNDTTYKLVIVMRLLFLNFMSVSIEVKFLEDIFKVVSVNSLFGNELCMCIRFIKADEILLSLWINFFI